MPLKLSEDQLAAILANNPDIEAQVDVLPPTPEIVTPEETAIEPYRYTRPILFADDISFPYIDVIPTRQRWRLPELTLPWQSWILLACLMFFLWKAPILAFAVWMFLCFCTPVLSIGKG